jgi:outer membrane receptor protein involved in Fe transport
VAWRPGPTVELYGSFGTGFHSNDARGTTLTVDPVTGEPASRVDALVGSRGFELGLRLQPGRRFQATLAGWSLRLDSELLFVGDAGNTEASRPSRREGVELGMYWYPNERYTASLEGAYTRSRFDDADPVGRRIPGSIPLVVSAGLTAHVADGWQASAQLRHFGAYPLVEDGSITSAGSTMVNLRLGREWRRIGLHLDLLNALDSEDHDVDYFYASRLPGEAVEGVDDVHFHIFPPRSLRFTLSYRF